MINSIDDIMKLVNAGFNAAQIAEFAKLEEKKEEPKETVQEPKENVQEPKENLQKDEDKKEQSAEIESLKAQIAALQAANVSANAGDGARPQTAEDVIHNVLKDFY